VLVFTRTKHGANKLAEKLGKDNIPAAAIHGNKSQAARTRALADFKSSKLQVLVATDIAARGIDIDQLPQVVNFELPNVPEDYVHRIGRTGRAGTTGSAVSLVEAERSAQGKPRQPSQGQPRQPADAQPRAAGNGGRPQQGQPRSQPRGGAEANGNVLSQRSGREPNGNVAAPRSPNQQPRSNSRPAAQPAGRSQQPRQQAALFAPKAPGRA
jgi:ATP-dependent RNA helicase RhlE